MGKNKFKRFQENLTFTNLIQPEFDEIFGRDHALKGHWREEVFANENPVVLELGCGRGEYTVAMGGMFPDKNFIGIDIKGARMWRGAKTATQLAMPNVAFLRTRIEFINSFFAPGEIDEIWITFPDPQMKKRRVEKRLTSPEFLTRYARMLKPEARLHLKTDSQHLHEYTKAVAAANALPVYASDNDIYAGGDAGALLSIKTAYETRFLGEGLPITYLCFGLDGKERFDAPSFPPDDTLVAE